VIGLQVLRRRRVSRVNTNVHFQSPKNLSPADMYMGLPVRIHSVIRPNPPAGRQVDAATKNGRKITHAQGMNTPYLRWLLERSINSSGSIDDITTPGCFLGTLRFDRRNVKFMTRRAISVTAVEPSIIIKNWLTTSSN